MKKKAKSWLKTIADNINYIIICLFIHDISKTHNMSLIKKYTMKIKYKLLLQNVLYENN